MKSKNLNLHVQIQINSERRTIRLDKNGTAAVLILIKIERCKKESDK